MLKITLKFAFSFLFFLSMSSCSTEGKNGETEVIEEISEEKKFDYSEIEKDILKLVNEYRTELELQPLKPIAEISLEAESHNFYMIEQGEVSHDNFAVRSEYLVNNLNAKAVSENVAYGYSSADTVVKGWLSSEGHRENIEGDYSHFGISVVDDEEGRNYFTNIFLRK